MSDESTIAVPPVINPTPPPVAAKPLAGNEKKPRFEFVEIPARGAAKGFVETPVASQDIRSAAKSLEPAIDTIVGMVSNTGSRVVSYYAGKITDKKVAKGYGDDAAMSEDCRETLKVAGARIAARRVKNEELLDFLAVGGALADYTITMAGVVSDLKQLVKDKKNGNSNPKS